MYILGSSNPLPLTFTGRKRKLEEGKSESSGYNTRSIANGDTFNARGATGVQRATNLSPNLYVPETDDTKAIQAALHRLNLAEPGSDAALELEDTLAEYHRYNGRAPRNHYLDNYDPAKEALVPTLDIGFLNSADHLTPDSIHRKLVELSTEEGATGRTALCHLHKYVQNPKGHKIWKLYQEPLLDKGLVRLSVKHGTVVVPDAVKVFVRENVQVDPFSQEITVRPPSGPIPVDQVPQVYKAWEHSPHFTFAMLQELNDLPSVQGRNAIKALYALVNKPNKKLTPQIEELLRSHVLVKVHPTDPNKVIVPPEIQEDVRNMVSISDYDDITLTAPKREPDEPVDAPQGSRRRGEREQ